MDTFLAAAAALAPPTGVGFLFYPAIRALVNADRNERTALARLEAAEDARPASGAGATGTPTPPEPGRVRPAGRPAGRPSGRPSCPPRGFGRERP